MKTQHLPSAQPTPAAQVITPDELIERVFALTRHRFHAYSAYPHSTSSIDGFKTILEIDYHLLNAQAEMNDRVKVHACLKQELALHQIAPSSLSPFRKSYMATLNSLMAACRTYLGLEAQR